MQKVFVKPKEGLQVPFSDMGVKESIPAEGVSLKLNSYIQRRVNSGELIIVEPPVKQTKKKG